MERDVRGLRLRTRWAPMNFYQVTGHEIAGSAGFDHGGQRLLGGGERLVRGVSARWDPRPELELSVRVKAAGIQIVLVEGRPDACRESGRGRQASLFLGRSSANPACGGAQAGEAPVVDEQWRTCKATKGILDV